MASRKLKLTLQQAAVPPLAGFPVRNFNRSMIRSLTPQLIAGLALAIADQTDESVSRIDTGAVHYFWQSSSHLISCRKTQLGCERTIYL
jgi:hypothetical protein